jgi:hypothetical protein
MLARSQPLPPSMARLCNRLATEETKAHTWVLCQQLREEYAQRMTAGESLADLEADIHARMLQAAHEQHKVTMAPACRPARLPAPQASRFPSRSVSRP